MDFVRYFCFNVGKTLKLFEPNYNGQQCIIVLDFDNIVTIYVLADQSSCGEGTDQIIK